MRAFTGAHIFITGATGFVGTWLMNSIHYANETLDTRIRVSALSRDPGVSRERYPWANFITGDVCALPSCLPRFDAVIHAATEPADGRNSARKQEAVFRVAVDGMEQVLTVAQRSGRIPLLFMSSGAVYGKVEPQIECVEESYRGAPDPLDARSAYGEGKRVSELLATLSFDRAEVKIARLFAFVAPWLPLNRAFAAGNFVRDALAGDEIVIKGDGTAVRSYLYGSDMTAWLWGIFARGLPGRAYNVGSELPVTIAQLASMVATCVEPEAPVRILQQPTGAPADRYVPCVRRAREELQLVQRVPLRDALERTISFYRSHPWR